MPRVRIRDATNTLRTVARIRMRDATNTLRTIQRIRVRDAGGALRTVWQYLQATVTPTMVSGSYNGSSGAAQNITTASCIAAPVGGTGPFTYSWAQVGVTPITWTILSPTAATTGFRANSVIAGSLETAFFECTITDSTGATAVTPIVTANAHNNSTA